MRSFLKVQRLAARSWTTAAITAAITNISLSICRRQTLTLFCCHCFCTGVCVCVCVCVCSIDVCLRPRQRQRQRTSLATSMCNHHNVRHWNRIAKANKTHTRWSFSRLHNHNSTTNRSNLILTEHCNTHARQLSTSYWVGVLGRFYKGLYKLAPFVK